MPTRPGSDRETIILVMIVASCVLIPWLGVSDFYTRGEPREAIVAQSMLISGDWISPEAYNEDLPSKPPLFHWLVALASSIGGGVTELTARAPSASSALAALAFFLFALRRSFVSRELLTFAVLLTLSFEWLRAGTSARVDMVHASCLSSGLLASFLALERNSSRMWVMTTLLLALATLAKGPVAVVIPAMVLPLWVILSRERPYVHLVKIALCLVCVLLLCSGWYIAAYLKAPAAFIEIFWDENIARFAGTMERTPHDHSVLYLLGMLLVGTLPSSLVVVFAEGSSLFGSGSAGAPRQSSFSGEGGFWRRARRYLAGARDERASLVRFSLLAASTVILFYCFPSSKRGVYLLAAYPFLAVCATAAVGSKVSSEKMRKLFLGGSALAVAVQALILPLVVAPRTSERDLAEVVLRHSSPTARIYSFGYEFYGAAFYSRRLFLRLEDAYSGTLRGMEANDLVLSFDSKAEELDAFLQANGVRARKVDMLPLGRRRVGIYRISQALDADLVATLPNGFDRDI